MNKKLDLKATLLSAGILLAMITFVLTLWNSVTGFASGTVEMIQEIYGGIAEFSGSWKGWSILVLTVFSFIDGALVGLIFALFYNLFVKDPEEKISEVSSEES